MLTKIRNLAVAALAVAALAGPAAAATYDITTQGKNAFFDANGKNAWYEYTSYKMKGQNVTAAAGVFRLKATDARGVSRDFLAFCLEPLEYLRLPRAYDDGTSLTQTQVGALGALVNNALKLVNNARSAAAFQLAAWEIANEGGKFELSKGAFVVTSANAKTKSLAQSWLDALNGEKLGPRLQGPHPDRHAHSGPGHRPAAGAGSCRRLPDGRRAWRSRSASPPQDCRVIRSARHRHNR